MHLLVLIGEGEQAEVFLRPSVSDQPETKHKSYFPLCRQFLTFFKLRTFD